MLRSNTDVNMATSPVLADLVTSGRISTDDPNGLYKDLRVIGHGSTAEVYKAIEISSGRLVAIKKFRSGTPPVEIAVELTIMQELDHPNVMPAVAAYFEKNRVWLVLHYCGGSCYDVLQRLKTHLNEKEIAAVCHQVLLGLNYLHNEKNILHRDLKAINILVTARGEAIISDFGISTKLSENATAHEFTGSPYWMAPEVILAPLKDGSTYSFPADIWALGITLIELAEGKPPLFHMEDMQAMYHIGFGVEEGTYTPPTLSSTSSWSPYFKDFLSKCLTIDPRDRWTAEALLRHSFITGSPNAKYDPYDASESVFVVADLVKRSLAHETTIEDMHKTSSIDNLVDFRPVPGNRVGGLSTVTERVPGTAETGCLLESNGDDTSIDEGRSRTISTGSRASFARHRSDNSDGNNSVGEHPEVDTSASLKLPAMIAAEEARAAQGGALFKAHMKAIREQRKRHEDEIRKLEEKHVSQRETEIKAHEQRLEIITKKQELSRSTSLKEQRQAMDKLLKATAASRSRVEDELKRVATRREREHKARLKAELTTIKKEHAIASKGSDKRSAARELKDVLTNATEALNASFLADEAKYYNSEVGALRARQRVLDNRMQHVQLKDELALSRSQLKESLELMLEGKAGEVVIQNEKKRLLEKHAMQTRHHIEQQLKMTQQQLARHSRDESALQRSHHTATKSLSNKMKKLPTLDVMEPTEMERYGTLNRKEQKTALRSAKVIHFNRETSRMEAIQRAGFQALMAQQQAATNDLKRRHQKQTSALNAAQTAERESLVTSLSELRQSTEAYVESQITARDKADAEQIEASKTEVVKPGALQSKGEFDMCLEAINAYYAARPGTLRPVVLEAEVGVDIPKASAWLKSILKSKKET